MANFSTTTTVIINDVSVKADSVAGSLAKEINDKSRMAYIIIEQN